LNIELLAYNFHESLDLGPLFKHVQRDLKQAKERVDDSLLWRVEKVAKEVKTKQIAALEESGGKLDASINLDELKNNLAGLRVIDGTISPPRFDVAGGLDPAVQKMQFKVEALYADPKKQEVRVILEVRPAQDATAGNKPEDAMHVVFTISPFDFPMIDNTRLPHGQRCALVVKDFGDPIVEITLVYFPGSRASLKEKPFYDEAMHDLLYTRTVIDKERKN